ncbi:hypothetical protein VTO42DRAFT_4539 [Malbranchea cinnamomea]
MTRLLTLALAAALSSPAALAAIQCNKDQKCPEDTPCCSLYGECGVGAYCLGGCDPFSSYAIESCVPAPICEGGTYKWNDLDSVIPNTKYLGDASKHDWVSSGQALVTGGNLLLTMAPDTVGTLMSHNHYMWYGKTTARLKTSRGKGVVTAFILMSDVKDEIDFEFIGARLDKAETNYYFQGITDYTNGEDHDVSDTFSNYHTYEIDWKPESITWSIDGNKVRVLERDSTFNESANRYEFPQTPSRVQLSLWPGGLPSNGEGTIEWAGGEIDWNHPDIQKHGYYYAMVDEVTVECYDPPSGAKGNGSNSYIYTDYSGLESSVEITDKSTVLKSLLGNGQDMDKDYPTQSGTATPTEHSEIPLIPGLSGGGPGTDGRRPSSDDDDDGDSGDSWDSGSSSDTEFSQNGDDNNDGTSGAPAQKEQVLRGSLFAVLVAVLALVTL